MGNLSTVIIIPTYNEKENISELVGKIIKLNLKRAEIIIVDDNSPDGTGELADKLAKRFKKRVSVIHRPEKLGLGSAYKAGFKKAFSDNADYIVTMDADLSHDPKVISKMLDNLSEFDVVIGSRYIQGGRIIGFGVGRNLLSALAQIISKTLLDLNVADSTSGFRAYRTSALKKIKPITVKSEGYSYLIEAIYRFQNKGFKISEIPITFKVRNLGKSKISQVEIFKALKTVVRLRLLKGS